MIKNASAKAPPTKISETRKDQLRQYKQDQRDRDATSGMSLLQARVKDSTKAFLENYRDEGGFVSIGAALDILIGNLSGEGKIKKKGK